MYKVLIFCFIITSVGFGCEKENRESFTDLIIGKWEWIETVSPWTGLVNNPLTEGYSRTLEFSTQGKMNWYKNDTLMNSTNYHIEKYSNDPDKCEIIYSSELRAHISLVNDSLFLNSAYVDGPISIFVRLE